MTDQSFPITPPPQLVQKWFKQVHESADPANQLSYCDFIATAAAQWGWDQRGTINEAQLQERADQELEACCEWLRGEYDWGLAAALRLDAERRPEPPSLKEQALAALDDAVMRGDCITISDALPTLRRALKALPND